MNVVALKTDRTDRIMPQMGAGKTLVEAQDFARIVTRAAAVVERRNTIAVLSFLHLSAAGDQITARGTDLDTEVVASCSLIDCPRPFAVGVAAAPLRRLLSTVPKKSRLTIDLDKDTFVIRCDEDEFRFNTWPVADYPQPFKGTNFQPFEEFDTGVLATELNRVLFAISTEETRYYLDGVCHHVDDAGRRLVATDGHRMSITDYSAEPKAKGADASKTIWPAKTARLLARFARGRACTLSASSNDELKFDNRLKFDLGDGFVIQSKLIDADYPDYQRVIPDTTTARQLRVPLDELGPALRRLTAMTSERQTVMFDQAMDGSGRLRLSINILNEGSASCICSVAWPAGAEPIGFNLNYLREIAAECSGEVSMRMIGSTSPAMIDGASPTHRMILMPMRV